MNPVTTWLFTGQGAQYPHMGQYYLTHHPRFREMFERCSSILKPLLGCDLLDVVQRDPDAEGQHPIHQTGLTQPALFVYEIAMATLLSDVLPEPQWLLGHSVGELAAATFAGCMRLEDGLTLIAHRARLMQAQPAGGGMAALMTDRKGAEALCDTLMTSAGLRLDLAGLNSPKQTVVSGSLAAIEALVELAKAQRIRAKALTVSHAFHSYLMEPMLAEFQGIASQIDYAPPRIPWVENTTGQLRTDAPDADYWCQQIRSAVHFSEGLTTLVDVGARNFVEVGPAPTLCGLGSRMYKTQVEMNWLPTTLGDETQDAQAWTDLLETLA